MGRLIDADVLLGNVKRAVYTDDLSTTIAVDICKSHIVKMPTVPAIPVEWLEDRVYDMKRAPLYRRYAEMLLMEWLQEQKEQGDDNETDN